MNPYENHGPSLENSARRCFLITPSDTVDLTQVCKAVRIFNPSNDLVSIRLMTDEGDIVTLPIPAGALWTEPLVTKRVFATGTGADLILHGYSD